MLLPEPFKSGNMVDSVWSDMSVGDLRLTWRELAEHYREQLAAARQHMGTLMDLDRCEHGRHEGDACGGCGLFGVPSIGNPFLPDGWGGPKTVPGTPQSRQIGFTFDGTPIVVPDRAHKHDPTAWKPGGR